MFWLHLVNLTSVTVSGARKLLEFGSLDSCLERRPDEFCLQKYTSAEKLVDCHLTI